MQSTLHLKAVYYENSLDSMQKAKFFMLNMFSISASILLRSFKSSFALNCTIFLKKFTENRGKNTTENFQVFYVYLRGQSIDKQIIQISICLHREILSYRHLKMK